MSLTCILAIKGKAKEVLDSISNGLVHTHARVRYEAVTALGWMLKAVSPCIQKNFHSNIIPALYILI